MGPTPWRALADQEGILVVDFRDHDRNGGFNFNYDVLQLNSIIVDVEAAFNVDTKRRYYHGFSAGAHWGYAVVLANANTFAGLGINAGSMNTAIQQGIWPGQVARKIPVAIRHGNTDAVVPVAAGQADRTRLQNANHLVAYEEFGGGHVVAAADAQAIWAFLKDKRAP
jgi:predicted esterase